MSASVSRPVEIGFELESAEKAYDYFINLVSNRETDDPNQFVYLGELHRGLIDGKKKHQYSWDTRLPVLSLEGGGVKAPPLGSVGVDRKELIGEMPLYLGGWWSELSNDLMVSYADYQAPGEEEKTHLILTTKYVEGGAGILDSVMLDSSLENQPPDGAGESENQVAPVVWILNLNLGPSCLIIWRQIQRILVNGNRILHGLKMGTSRFGEWQGWPCD